MLNNPEQTISEYFSALRAMDVDRWVNTFAPTATSNDPVGTPPLHGHDALRAFATGMFSLFQTVGLTEDNVFRIGNAAAVKWTGNGTGKNGKSVTFEGIDVIEVDASGKIILVNAYWDPAPVLATVQS
jgi:steroid delta-isomerase